MKIELLSIHLLETARPFVQQFQALSNRLKIGLGWHYLLDLSWAAQELSPVPGARVLDAGAGYGLIQWWLVEQGIDVISVDRYSRYDIPRYLREKYRIQGLRRGDLSPLSVRDFLPSRSPSTWRSYPKVLESSIKQLSWHMRLGSPHHTVFIYNQDLISMPDIPDNSVDHVVSISSLEHNSSDELRLVVRELMRVIKPGGKLIATLGASKEQDWYHEPSGGWCYTEHSLREIFDLTDQTTSNYERYDEYFELLKEGEELRANLADFYYRSGDNGMPWGVWDPKYQPVGIVKVKPE
jgi:ubiquinone/menaquinone biosynthesis C-methylase UbiE